MYLLFKLISLVPLWLQYAINDILIAPLLHYVVRYRLKLVRKNLSLSFPDKSKKELRRIEHQFYRHFTDVFLEMMHIPSMSDSEIRRRVVFKNPEIAMDLVEGHKGLIAMLTHCANWEWSAFAQRYYEWMGFDVQVIAAYRAPKNESVMKPMLRMRERTHCKYVTKQRLIRAMVERHRGEQKTFWGLNADQKPNPQGQHFWTTFLNQETAILTGSEELAKKFDYPVVYYRMTKVKRGYYELEVIPISANPKQEEQYAITGRYAQLMEEDINAHPEQWLWTHNRWKHKRVVEN